MKNTIKHTIKKIYNKFQTGINSEVKQLKSFFCIVFRHDMDDMVKEDIEKFYDEDKKFGVESALFFMVSQISSYHKTILKMENYDIQLHTISKPIFYPLHFTCITESLYRRNLRKEFKTASKYFNISGHAPHGSNNYILDNINTGCDLIENASINSGFKWFSDYRNMLLAGCDFNPFPRPFPVYRRTNISTGSNILVFSTAWDDRFYKTSLLSRDLFNVHRFIDEPELARKNILTQIEYCKYKDIPFIINLHPTIWLNKWLTTDRIKEWLIEYSAKNKIPVLSFSNLYNQLV